MDEITVSSAKGFKFIATDIVHDTEYQRIRLEVVHVPDSNTGKTHHIALVITKLSKTPKQTWAESEVSKTYFTSDKTESLQKLLAFLRVQPDLAQFKNAKLEISASSGISASDRDFIQRVLVSFDTSEKRELLVLAKKEDVNNLYAAVKHAKNKKATKELSSLLKDETKESELQHWIKENTWVFGVEYLNFLDARRIGINSESDFIVESLDGYADLIELKKCGFKLFNYDSSHESYYPTSELSQVLGQSIKYLKVMEDSRFLLKEASGMEVLKPRIKIVIGLSSKMNDKEKESLRLLNDSLHNIEIMTYDEIRSRAERLNNHYASA